MLATLKTLIIGSNARAENMVRDHFAIELIDQKIKEAEASLKAAKLSLASFIQRERAEAKHLGDITARIHDLTSRATQALAANRTDLAEQAAQAIAQLENEQTLRQGTLGRLETRIAQLRHTVEIATRRLLDLKQGALAARTAKKEADLQNRLGVCMAQDTAFDEAEDLISRVLNKDDPFERSQILQEIDADLNGTHVADQLAEAGFGKSSKITAADVMGRLRAQSTPAI